MDFSIRICKLSDAGFISQLNCEQMGYTYSTEETENKISLVLSDDRQRIFVAEKNDVVLGYIHAAEYELLYAPKMINVLGIAVSKEYQRNGVGRALLIEVENWAKDVNAFCVRLSSGSERTAAHEFYNKCGYIFSKNQANFKKTI